MNKLSDWVKKLPELSPRMGDAFTPRLGVDEEIAYSYRGKNYRILIIKITKKSDLRIHHFE